MRQDLNPNFIYWWLLFLSSLFLGTGFAMCSRKESHDSDADLDVDGDDTLEYGKAQYPWLVVLRCLALQWRCCELGMAKAYRSVLGQIPNGSDHPYPIGVGTLKWAGHVRAIM